MPLRTRFVPLPPPSEFVRMPELERLGYLYTILERMWSLLRLLAVVVLVVLLLWVVSSIQLQLRNNAIHNLQRSSQRLEVSTKEARDAATQARDALAAAIKAGQSGQLDPRVARALAQIDCIAHGRMPCAP